MMQFNLRPAGLLLRAMYMLHSPCRKFLSPAFDCTRVWENRLISPILKNVDTYGFYQELDSQYRRTRRISPIDVDIFVNSLQDEEYAVEVEEMLYRLRQTPHTIKTLPTTHHVYIRLLLSWNRTNDLIRILNDRTNYGIFPDDYCLVFLMNTFLKQKDYRKAAKIGCLSMFQEDYSDPLLRYVSLYSIHKYIQDPTPWDEVQPEPEKKEDDDEEEVKVRVKYLRNPYFDDHFDLKDGNHICGKSLAMIGSYFDNSLGRSYRCMGLALYNKWDKLENYLKSIVQLKDDTIVYKDCISFIEPILTEKLVDEAKLGSIRNYLEQLKTRAMDNNLLDTVEKELKDLVSHVEESETKKQEERFVLWEKLRENELKTQLALVEKQKKLEEIKRKKDELFRREQLLYYFENEDEIDLVVEEKQAYLEEKAQLKFLGSTEEEEAYVPPEVKKKFEKRSDSEMSEFIQELEAK